MVETISVGQDQVEVNRRRGLRGMNLSVKPDGQVRVRCNVRRARDEIAEFVEACADFIARRRQKIRDLELRHPVRSIISGEEFLWMGYPLKLDVVWTWNKRIQVKKSDDSLEMLAPVTSTPAERSEALEKFYRGEAKHWLEARVQVWSRISGLKPNIIRIRGQRTLWGSCTSEGALSLNWKLLCSPPEVIDYVVVHELCHLREQNHSSRFWNLVGSFVPQYETHRKWLRDNQQAVTRQFLTRPS